MNGPFEGGCRLQSGAGAWLACNTSASDHATFRRATYRLPYPYGSPGPYTAARTGYSKTHEISPRRLPRLSLSRARSLSLSRVIHARSLPLHESGHGFVFCPKKGQRPERLGVLKS